MMIKGPREIGVYTSPGKDAGTDRDKWWKMGKPMPIAAAYGIDPLLFLVGATSLPKTESEYEYYSGIKGSPIELFTSDLTGLPLPAHAEIILEGHLYPDETFAEGPFGEFTGYYGRPSGATPYMRVERLRYRNNPTLTCALMADGPSNECGLFWAALRSAGIWADLQKLGVPGIQGVWSIPEAAGWGMTVVSIKQMYAGHAPQVMALAAQCTAGAYFGKYVIVVDDDIDPSNIGQVLWAMATRSRPAQSIDILRETWSTFLDPSLNPPEIRPWGSKALINACMDYKYIKTFSPRTKLDKETYDQVVSRWSETGLRGKAPEINDVRGQDQREGRHMNIQNQPKGSRERTLDEVKAEFMRRAGKLNPFEDIKREDAETRDGGAEKPRQAITGPRSGARSGSATRRRATPRPRPATSGKELAEIYMHAFDACRVGRYPSPSSPGKLAAYQHSLRMFRKAAAHFDPQARDRRGAVRGQEARRLSAKAAGRRQAAGRHALGRRRRLEGGPPEDRQDRDGRRPRLAHHRHAGQRREPGAVRRSGGRAHVLDVARLSADAHRHRRPARRGLGRQLRRLLGGAARLHRRRPHQGRGVPRRQRALRLPARMAGAGLHHRRRDLSVRRGEPARRARPRDGREDASRNSSTPCAPLSLKTMGLLDKTSAPLLGVNGKLDDQAPIADVYLLMEHGNPKSARVYPEGHHMGRTPGQHPDEIANMIVGWLKEQLARVASPDFRRRSDAA